MTLFEERQTFDLFDKDHEGTRPDAVLRVVVSSSRDVNSEIIFTVLRKDRKTVQYKFGLGWHRDLDAIGPVLDNTGYDLGHAHPITHIKAWLFDLTA